MSTPTPRDLFGSRGRAKRQGDTLNPNPVISPPDPNATGLPRVTDWHRWEVRVDPRERRMDRPAAGYGSENVALYVGFRQMAIHEGDVPTGYGDGGPGRRATFRGPLTPRRRYDVNPDPSHPGSQDKDPRCASVKPHVFDPPGKSGYTREQRRELTKLCRSCPVFNVCLEYALTTKVAGDWVDGWWAGTTKADRTRIREQGA